MKKKKEQNRKIYYKVVTKDLKSVGLKPKGKQVPIVQYRIGRWAHPLEPISSDPDRGGGLWINPRLGGSRTLVRYLWREYRRRTRVFVCVIGKVLCQPTSYRAKTDKVKLLEEIDVSDLYN